MHAPRLSVLFLCTGNSARSQMAETILRHFSQQAIDVASAGTHPQAAIHPMARRAVERLVHVSMDGQYPKTVDSLSDRHFDFVVTVCDRAAETCPLYPGTTTRLHWGYEDPATAAGTEEQQQHAFDEVASQLSSRIRDWLASPVISSRLHADPE